MDKILSHKQITANQVTTEDELVDNAHKYIDELNKRLTSRKLLLEEVGAQDQEEGYLENQAEFDEQYFIKS